MNQPPQVSPPDTKFAVTQVAAVLREIVEELKQINSGLHNIRTEMQSIRNRIK